MRPSRQLFGTRRNFRWTPEILLATKSFTLVIFQNCLAGNILCESLKFFLGLNNNNSLRWSLFQRVCNVAIGFRIEQDKI